ncbi:MAG TPA: hypothetical protein VNG70_12620 [Candidatus Limnocylindria bacterium]|nr:hypothetical protein [Candidatus Limnocylindria bacterium]
MIIGKLVSLPSKRLLATLVTLLACASAGVSVLGATPPPSTWVALAPLPLQGQSAIFALAVGPTNNQVLVAGTGAGSLLRSGDGGSTWKVAGNAPAGVLTVAFSPFKGGLVLAGTRGGALVSKDAGTTWATVKGLEGRSVRVFGFALTFVAAGTDRGVYVSADGVTWRPSGLPKTSIGSLAVTAIHDPVRLVAGGDAASTNGGMPLYQSADGGITWAQMRPSISGNVVSCVAAGPLPPKSTVRPLIVGTNAGLFTSRDNGVTFAANSGGGLLPSTDYTQIAFVTTHFDRYYTASDGGGSASGGLWRTVDSGGHFTSLAPPMPSVTALAVSNDEAPILYVAGFRPADQTAALWAYHDTGGPPKGPPAAVTPSTSGSRTAPTPTGTSAIAEFLLSSRTPYIAIGLVAMIVIIVAVVSHFRGRRG